MNDPGAQHVTTKPAAKAVGVHPSTLWRYYRKGLVAPAWITPGGHLRWDIAQLRLQIESMQEELALKRPPPPWSKTRRVPVIPVFEDGNGTPI